MNSSQTNSGFTYIGALMAVAIVSIGLTVAAELWVKTSERQKQAQLDWVGQQYVQAIESYYNSNTGSVHYYPPNLEALLLDDRYLNTKRHLRKIYINPITNQNDWQIIPAPSGGIAGLKTSTPRKEYTYIPIN